MPWPANSTLYIWILYRSKDGVLSTPFGGTNGINASTTLVTGDNIANATIDTAKIADGAIVNAKIGQVIQSTTFTAGYTGWRIDKGGSAEFNSITVYDGAGNTLLSSGGGVSWGGITGAGKPADNATRNVYRGTWAAAISYAQVS